MDILEKFSSFIGNINRNLQEEKRSESFSQGVFSALSLALLVPFSLVNILLFLGFSLNTFNCRIIAGVTLLLMGIAHRKSSLFFSLAFIGLALLLPGFFRDGSHDKYFQECIELFAGGWNHIYDPFTFNGDPLLEARITSFTKGPHILQAFVQLVFNDVRNVNLGFTPNYLLFFGLFFGAYSYFGTQSTVVRALLAFIIANNPVAIAQLNSLYVDGQLASSFAIIFLLLFQSISKPLSVKNSVFLVLYIIYAVNTKLSSCVYIAIILFFFAIVHFRRKEYFKKYLIQSGLGLGLAVLLFGFNPLITNTVKYKSPFYPMMSFVGNFKDYSYEHHGQIPSNMAGRNRFVKMYYSLFGRTHMFPQEAVLKIPFDVTEEQIRQGATVSPMTGGLGVLFSAVFLLFLVFLGMNYRLLMSEAVLIPFLGLLVSVIINKEMWWIRFNPQMWLVPLALFVAIGLNESFPAQKKFTIPSRALWTLALLNVLFCWFGIIKYAT